MKIHFSVDDVIYSLKDLAEKKPKSIFDLPFFDFLERMNKEYGAVFTLYMFENFAESFFVNDIPKEYWDEMCACGFLKVGFHGTFFEESYEVFTKKCRNFYSCVPKELWSGIIRLHRYAADEYMIDTMKNFGLEVLLCREDKCREDGDFPDSYILSGSEEKDIDTKVVYKNQVGYLKTIFRIEHYEKQELLLKLSEKIELCDSENDIISIFTHEKICGNYFETMEEVCRLICSKKIDYLF